MIYIPLGLCHANGNTGILERKLKVVGVGGRSDRGIDQVSVTPIRGNPDRCSGPNDGYGRK